MWLTFLFEDPHPGSKATEEFLWKNRMINSCSHVSAAEPDIALYNTFYKTNSTLLVSDYFKFGDLLSETLKKKYPQKC